MPRRHSLKQGQRRGYAPWTRDEIATLVREWHDVAPRTLACKLANHSWQGIVAKAVDLGLPMGIPQGHESIRAAAKRAGISPQTMRLWLEAEGVQMTVRWHRKATPPKGTHRYVATEAVDAMMRRRCCETESVASAARRLGIHAGTLWSVMHRLGLLKSRGPGRAILLPSEVFDRAMAAYRPKKVAA